MMKSWYVTVITGCTQVDQKKCISAKEATEALAAMKEKYPNVPGGPVYTYYREQF